MAPEHALAEFIDYCLQRYVSQPSYWLKLEAERPGKKQARPVNKRRRTGR